MYPFEKIEKKWQRKWQKDETYTTKDTVKGKKNFYHLVMFPYPSGNLHIGHWYNFAPADIVARYKRMQGYNVMSPIGFDAFGLPAENAAIKRGIHPERWTMSNIKTMKKQLHSMGNSFDWSREVITCLPEYYKWNQWIFLQLYKEGLVYRQKAAANWCPSCKTVLANEQVVDGACERCGTDVTKKEIDQWMFRITRYVEDLLKDLDTVDWPERTKAMQRNWIGRSEGAYITFDLQGATLKKKRKVKVFTTRPDTVFGVTYVVLAPEHELISDPVVKAALTNYFEVETYIEKTKAKSELERTDLIKGKTGSPLAGITAINPATGEEVPVWIADYVLASYGTGAVMAVPAHDERDFDFARNPRHNLPIRPVIIPEPVDIKTGDAQTVIDDIKKGKICWTCCGLLINSAQFNGNPSEHAKNKIVAWLAKKKAAKKGITYRLRDWLISRQRYWGTPIPIVFCEKCGIQPIKEKDLPITLPPLRNFQPASDGRSPLARSKDFVATTCPQCGGRAERETDTMDTFVDSSWYYLRYIDNHNAKAAFNKKKMEKWLPVDMYIGGAEHTVLHLLYARFFTKFLAQKKYIDFNEPFTSLRHQGIILGPDGLKMSKSKGNVIDPDDLVDKFGADAVRMYLCFMGPYDQGGPWNPTGILGMTRFLDRLWILKDVVEQNQSVLQDNDLLQGTVHRTIKKVTEDIEGMKFNTAISALMILLNEMEKQRENLPIAVLKQFVQLLAPFAPHVTEEIWQNLADKKKKYVSIHHGVWPKYEEQYLKEDIVGIVIQINGKIRAKISIARDLQEERVKEIAFTEKNIRKYIDGKEIKKVIYIPNKLLNIVI
ncbi:MAG: leucine--tRNA ligase [bacterium]